MAIGIAWGAFALLSLGTIVFSWLLVRYYQDKHESERLPTITSVIGITITLLGILLIPVDIYSVSLAKDPKTGKELMPASEVQANGETLFGFYIAMYAIIILFLMLFLPFAYFYYEEDDEDMTPKRRAIGSLKYTSFFIVAFIIMLVIGLTLQPGENPGGSEAKWAQKLLDTSNGGEKTVEFAIACLIVLGFVEFTFYTGFGISGLPVGMIRGRLSMQEEQADFSSDLAVTREKTRAIESKYNLTGRRMTKKDKKTLESLKRQERLLNTRSTNVDLLRKSRWQKVKDCCRPFTLLFGAFLLLLALFIVTSLVMSTIDKAASSTCGTACGFLLSVPSVNPLDLFLTAIASIFPFDYLVLIGMILFIVFATMSGITSMGIRFLWVHMYRIKKGASVPQGVLMTSGILMLIVLCLNAEMLTLAPQYATFGSQTYVKDGKVTPCSINAPDGECHMTQLSMFINRALIKMPTFGVVYFAFNWLFILFFIVGLIYHMIRKKKSVLGDLNESSDSDVDDYA